MQVGDFDDDDMIEGDVDGRAVEDDLEQWTVDTFNSLPMAGESAATMVSVEPPHMHLGTVLTRNIGQDDVYKDARTDSKDRRKLDPLWSGSSCHSRLRRTSRGRSFLPAHLMLCLDTS